MLQRQDFLVKSPSKRLCENASGKIVGYSSFGMIKYNLYRVEAINNQEVYVALLLQLVLVEISGDVDACVHRSFTESTASRTSFESW